MKLHHLLPPTQLLLLPLICPKATSNHQNNVKSTYKISINITQAQCIATMTSSRNYSPYYFIADNYNNIKLTDFSTQSQQTILLSQVTLDITNIQHELACIDLTIRYEPTNQTTIDNYKNMHSQTFYNQLNKQITQSMNTSVGIG